MIRSPEITLPLTPQSPFAFGYPSHSGQVFCADGLRSSQRNGSGIRKLNRDRKHGIGPIVITIQAIFDADADGSVHLPLPMELRQGKVMVIATLTKVEEPASAGGAVDYLRRIAARGGLKSIEDPARWQEGIREDRPLPGRNE